MGAYPKRLLETALGISPLPEYDPYVYARGLLATEAGV
jgi:hypothetical protein